MKRTTIVFILSLICLCCKAQKLEYTTFIYTSDNLADEIAQKASEDESRGYLADLFAAGREASNGIASGYVTSFINMGVNAIGSLFTSNARHKQEWNDMVKEENVFQTQISTVSEVNDFYKETSFDGAMDPKGMTFDGIGCLRMEEGDTVFYISCHIDRSKINRIINHSKFELVLDTLIISPTRSNLPNTALDIPYSFKERKNFTLSMDIRLLSSWMNEIVQLQKDQELGHFSINIPVDESVLDANGFLRYTRRRGEASAYKVLGESFIVPRSFMGHRDENDNYRNSWGTGEYKLDITLKETCEATDSYRKNWKADRKQRKRMAPKPGFFKTSWQTISNQRWDELSKSWIITTLQAPADIISRDIIEKLGLSSSKQNGLDSPSAQMATAHSGKSTPNEQDPHPKKP